MTTHYRKTAALALGSLLVSVAACGGDDADDLDAAAEEPSDADAARSAAGADEGASAAEQAALDAAGGEELGGSVSMLGVLGGDELAAFESVLEPFTAATGVDVDYEATRDIAAVLQTRVDGGNPPDVATNPTVGQMIDLATDGELVDLGVFLDAAELTEQYDEALLGGITVDGRLSGIYTAVNLEGLIWHDPNSPAEVPTSPETFADLQSWAADTAADGTTPWCIGLESGAASGWPGVVWITELVLRGAGPDLYTQWWQGDLPWTAPDIREAFETFGAIATDPEMVNGGPTAVLATNFANGGDGLFSDPPQCYLHHQASFYGGIATGNFPELEPIEDIAAFPFPDVDPDHANLRQVSGEVLGMFNDTPQARALITYLASPEAQTLLAETGIWLSANKAVDAGAYPSPFTALAAEIVQAADGIYYDGSSLMPTDMNAAFATAILDYVADPSSLDQILSDLDAVQATAYAE
ncbi:MAG: ABC transporter substrate-binding protein [Actinomycetota bacterium]|nr:ABC transporter substrate-binding protein [Actinomycetota bacterium]